MQKRILGQNLSVSAIGYGAMGLSHAYGTAVEKMKQSKLFGPPSNRVIRSLILPHFMLASMQMARLPSMKPWSARQSNHFGTRLF